MHVPFVGSYLREIKTRRTCILAQRTMEAFAQEAPIRGKLLNLEQLERHAKALSGKDVIATKKSVNPLLARLSQNEMVLNHAYELIGRAAERNRRIAPAAEWLLDNFYLIEEQIRATRRLLPRSFSSELPRLANGQCANYPRAYGIARELVAHTDGRVDIHSLNAFVTAYQANVPLKLGELWALPLMLRLAIIENLRRVASRLAQGRCHRDFAVDWAERMLKTVEGNPTDLILVLADMAREHPPLSGAFVAELTRHLQGHNPNFAFVHSWLEHRLADQGENTEQLVLAEGQAQAEDQVSVGNSITSLRFVSVNDWRKFVTDQSLVEQTLNKDPQGVYARMDFATRDRYRHAVEGIAKRSSRSEYDVANRAVQLAQAETQEITNHRSTHVGYFLVDDGRPALERLMHMRLTLGVLIDKTRRKFPMIVYLLPILLLTTIGCTLLVTWGEWSHQNSILQWLLIIPVLLCTSQLAISIANWMTTTFMQPQPLPKMDFQEGIPKEHRTLVVVPTMLSSEAGIERLLEMLEIRYLANRDANLHFAILTDLLDASQEVMPDDDKLVRLASEGIARLNELHEGHRTDIFLLFHRGRRWNAQEKKWMGHERKRGKLADLNATLRGALGRFAKITGDTTKLAEVRYVITLDTDTQLPRDAAHEMVGAMAHPLNRPHFDVECDRVTFGYTILQPRVGVSLPSASRSWYVRLFGGDPGIDPYTRVVSDVYQDLFGEGSFVGKGIYDVDSFERNCGNFPENAILSHDLLEGCYSRSALLSDVILYEDFPSSYLVDVSRHYRWIRGDWQIASWLMPRVPTSLSRSADNPLTLLSWWKIFDNLRRSVMPIGTLVLLAVAWLAGTPGFASVASLLVLSVYFVPVFCTATMDLAHKPTDLPVLTHAWNVLAAMCRPLLQNLFHLTLLPFEAMLAFDAIGRTLYRVGWSKRNLLEWRTSQDASRLASDSFAAYFRTMFMAPVLALGLLVLLLVQGKLLLLSMVPMLVLWFFSPGIAWYLSRILRPRLANLTVSQELFLRRMARKTWRYFEKFVTARENWLPPDNVQFSQGEVVSSRTSPTNIGMAFLADLAAYDFGYCSVERLLDRTEKTLATLARMERYHGHLYNWYDTQTLAPLAPRYVSTVDSGNLAAQMLVMGSGLRLLANASSLPPALFLGLRDTLSLCLEDVVSPFDGVKADGPHPIDGNLTRDLDHRLEELERTPLNIRNAAWLLPQGLDFALRLKSCLQQNQQSADWPEALERAYRESLSEIQLLASWTAIVPVEDPILARGPPSLLPLWNELNQQLTNCEASPILSSIATLAPSTAVIFEALRKEYANPSSLTLDEVASIGKWLTELQASILQCSQNAANRIRRLQLIAVRCEEFAQMDFAFLHDKNRDLFSIGYNVNDNRLDTGFYDLLASEARLASYLVIAQGHFGQEHWFALGRLLTNTGGAPALLSWSGSMFEYLMPLLVMPTYEHTILDETYKAIVRRQIYYGRQRNVPWGISESGYNIIDWNSNYQYRSFGVPGLGLKRGLAEDLVIAPYASALALMVQPQAACHNLERLANEGQSGDYGFYEAVDYTPSRLLPNTQSVTVRQYMAHHEGMSLLAFAYVLLDKPMQRRFHANPELHAADLLLHERVPKSTIPVYPHAIEANSTRSASAEEAGTMRIFNDPFGAIPEVHLLSNGQLHLMVTSAGGGYCRWRDLAVTRWREDVTRDCWGPCCYLRDVETNDLWSTSWFPTCKTPERYEAIFSQAQAEFRRSDSQIDSHTQISISSEENIELRRVTLTNNSSRVRTIEITSFAEVVLASQAQDESHPAFSNLFVQSEIVANQQAIYCTRRPRSTEEHPPWMIHMMTTKATTKGAVSYETDRMQFIGRGRNLAFPQAFDEMAPLSNRQGATLDPMVGIRLVVEIQPSDSVRIDIVSGVAETRAEVQAMGDKYRDPSLADRVFELAWTRGPIMLQQLNASQADAQTYGRLASSVVFASSLRRAKPSVLIRSRRGQSGLWGYGISGDLPIVLLRIRSSENIELVRQAVKAHAYWRMKGLPVDLVLWNEDDSVYRQSLQEAIQDVVTASSEAALVDRPGGVFIRRGEQMSDEDRSLLMTVARVVLFDDAGTLSEQVERRARVEVSVPNFRPARKVVRIVPESPKPKWNLAFENGLGGFSQDGREYIIVLEPGSHTPAPWVNVIANPLIGSVVSESGSSFTWVGNSHEFRLTPWSNDPVSDPSGEVFYLRDEETGKVWSPTPSPVNSEGRYVTRHGFGYTIFDHTENGITTELCVYVDVEAPVKFAKLKITNHSGSYQHLSITGYWEWTLGEMRSKSLMHIVTEIDPMTGAIFARNPYSPEFANQVVFVECSEPTRTYTCDRTEFIGRNGSLANPAAMRKTRLSNHVGAGLDPCAAIQTHIHLQDGQEKTILFTLGAGTGEEEARSLIQRFRSEGNAYQALEKVWHYWSHTLSAVYVETPDQGVNFMANGWLMYQTLVCRMWARSGFYQSGGAYGYRDQLQDSMALVYAEPTLYRQHLLRACSRQFREGDVQHWWHPPAGRGVRTHFSDDFLWLPFALCRYVKLTGDRGILQEMIPFLSAKMLNPEDESNYDLPHVSDDVGTVFEHAVRAINHGLRFGVHGLPLMGCGDWNDGMNLVGRDGKGESVWLAFFLYEILNQFSELALLHGDPSTADRLSIEAGRLRGNIEQHAWDGEWYRRAYFDDGTPLGSAENEECQIDSISQSWSVMSGAGTRERSVRAMESVDFRLVRRQDRLIQLLTPPFDHSDLNPGYIKGYVPGVRENGGQYTHAAIWTAMAFAELGDRARVAEFLTMLNPISHGDSQDAIARYRVEPYVVAADVYGVAPHTGRGGWTWYTGSAGWMYRLMIESVLGLQLSSEQLTFTPCLPSHWPSFKMHYRFRQTVYHIEVMNGGEGKGVKQLTVDGVMQAQPWICLVDDQKDHQVQILLQ